MPISSFISLSPNQPYANTYDPANPGNPWAYGYLLTFGGIASFYPPAFRLPGQHALDELVLGYSPADPTDQVINDLSSDVYAHSCLYAYIGLRNVKATDQFLLLFGVRAVLGSPDAQFFIGSEMMHTQPLAGDDQVAIIVDSPPLFTSPIGGGTSGGLNAYARLASATQYVAMAVSGVDCYRL